MSTASEEVAALLRSRIVQGHWAPGSRLPARVALAQEVDSCLATLQEAVGQLVEEGFLEVGARKKGTYVAAHPPHRSRYRLIFPFGPDTWGQFWHALEEAAAVRSTPEREFLCFYGLSGHRDISEYREVVAEVQAQRVAGLLFASSAEQLAGTPLFEAPGIPRVAIAAPDQLPGIPKVHVDLPSFFELAIDTLTAAGRRRIALLAASPVVQAIFRNAMTARDLPCREAWEQFAAADTPAAARHLMALLFLPGQPEHPDGLIIADDNLIPSAAAGLAAAGIAVPEALTVVGMTNFPHIQPAAVPVNRIGFDVPHLLDLLVERLQQVRAGESPAEFTPLPARLGRATTEPAPTAALAGAAR